MNSLPTQLANAPVKSNLDIEFRTLTTGEDLRAIGTAWRSLEERAATAAHFFQTWTWTDAWWRQFGSTGSYKLRILTAQRGTEIVLVWPLVESRHGLVRMLEPTGGLLACYGDALVSDREQRAELLARAWEELEEIPGIDAFSFPAVRDDAQIANIVSQRAGNPIDATTAPTLRLTGYDKPVDYLASLSKGFRKELRRSERKLAALGELRHRINDPRISPRQAIETVLRFKREWLIARGLSGKTVMSPAGESFLADFCERLETHGGAEKLRVSSLWLEDHVIAIGIAFAYHGQQLEYFGGFDYKYHDYGPGKVQLAASIEDAIACGDDFCDLLTPETEFKNRWTKHRHAVRQYFFAKTWRSALYRALYLRALRPIVKRVYGATIPRMRRRRIKPTTR